MDSDIYNELVATARCDAKETFSEEQLGYWLSGPGTPAHEDVFPPKAERVWADEVVRLEGTGAVRKATDEEWKLYETEYDNALNRAIAHIAEAWDTERDDDSEHYNDVYEEAVELILRPTE